MDKKKLYLLLQSILCVVLCALLIAAVLGVSSEGAARKAEDPLARIFTREKAAAALAPILPLLLAAAAMTALGLVLQIRDERTARPGKDRPPHEREPRGAVPPSRLRLLRAVLLVLALALIAAGILNGSAQDVFGKAVKICSECVGLG